MLSAVACAGAVNSGASTPSRSVIGASELAGAGTESVLDVIQRARPEYLRARPAQTYVNATTTIAAPPALIVNGQRAGELADLRMIPAVTLSQVRYYSIEEAKRRFGMEYGGGAIELTYVKP